MSISRLLASALATRLSRLALALATRLSRLAVPYLAVAVAFALALLLQLGVVLLAKLRL